MVTGWRPGPASHLRLLNGGASPTQRSGRRRRIDGASCAGAIGSARRTPGRCRWAAEDRTWPSAFEYICLTAATMAFCTVAGSSYAIPAKLCEVLSVSFRAEGDPHGFRLVQFLPSVVPVGGVSGGLKFTQTTCAGWPARSLACRRSSVPRR